MQVKRLAWIAAALCIISALFYIIIMIFYVGYELPLSSYGYFYSGNFRLVLLMLMFAVITLVFVLRAAVNSRGFIHALVFETIYLGFLVLSYVKIYHGVYSLLRLIGYSHYTTMDMFFLIIIFIPCILSMIFGVCACVKAKLQAKSSITQKKEEHI